MASSGFRFVHTADWQIGRQYQRFEPEDAAALFEARFAVVQRIADYAAQHDCDAVLVAGDVFDAQTVSERTVRRLFNAMQGFGGPWVLIPGNHDAALAESVWTRAQQLEVVPSNVHLALAAQPVLLQDLGVAILPAPLTQRRTHHDLTAWFDHAQTPDGYMRVGLAHGSVSGILSDDVDSANPLAPDRAARARLDYLALGDWHGMRSIDARTWYSGTPETDRFRNNESGHLLDVSISGPGATPQVRAVRVGQYVWDAPQFQISMPTDAEQVVDYLQTLGPEHVVSLVLSGHLDLATQRRLLDAVAAAQARVRALDVEMDALALQPTDDDIAALQADGYVADVLHTLRGMLASASAQQPNDTHPAVNAQHSTNGQQSTSGQHAAAVVQSNTADAIVARDALALLAEILQEQQ